MQFAPVIDGPDNPPGTLPMAVLSHAAAAPGATAFNYIQASGAAIELSFGDLAQGAGRVAQGLLTAGCETGARVALMYGHGPAFVTGLMGIFLAGCAAVPVAPPSGPVMRERARAILAEAGCFVILTDVDAQPLDEPDSGNLFAGHEVLRPGDFMQAPDAVPELGLSLTRPEEVAVVQYTSGSTKAPRGVVVTHGALAAQQRAIAHAIRPQGRERVVTWLPPEHDMGLMGGLMFNLWRGQPTWVLSPAAFIRRPILWLEAISRHKATISVAPNFAYDLCVRAIPPERRAGLDLSSWQVALNGSEPVRPETMQNFAQAFGPLGFDARAFLPCYGLAEATLLVSGASRGTGAVTGWFDSAALEQGMVVPCAAGVGRLLSSSGPVRTTGGVRIVVPETGQPCPTGRIGEIWIAGDSLGSGYLGRTEDSQINFGARTIDGAGPYLRSGDTGFLCAGELYVTGRIKDIILWHARTLHAADLERVLDGVEPRVRPGRIALHQSTDGGVTLLAEIGPTATGSAGNMAVRGTSTVGADPEAEIALRLWRRLLGQIGVEANRVVLARPGTLLWTSSGKLRRKASHERLSAEPDRVLLDWRPDSAESRRRQALATWNLGQLHAAGGAGAAAFLDFFSAWVAAATGVWPADVDPDLPWADQGLDSLMMTELVLDLEAATGQQLDAESLFELRDPQRLAAELAGRARP